MHRFDQYGLDEPVQYEVNLDISGFVRVAVKDKLNRDTILVYLLMVSETPAATDKMRRFFPIAQEHDLSRSEILVWLHLSYGGSTKPRNISRKLRLPPRFVENALASLKEKGIIN